MLRSRLFIVFNGLQIVALMVFFLVAAHQKSEGESDRWPAQVELVRTLRLTDLSVWTEARYTRHPSQADRFSAFQDLPSSLEHFPAGSVVTAPPTLVAAPTPGP